MHCIKCINLKSKISLECILICSIVNIEFGQRRQSANPFQIKVFLTASKKVTGEKKACLYLGRLWVCAVRGDVDDVGGDEGACRPWGEVGRVEAWGRKVAPWCGGERQVAEEEGEEEEGGTG